MVAAMSDVDQHAERLRAALNTISGKPPLSALAALEWFKAEVTRLREALNEAIQEYEKQQARADENYERWMSTALGKQTVEAEDRCVRLEAALQEIVASKSASVIDYKDHAKRALGDE